MRDLTPFTRITLSKLAIHTRMSEETVCFEAKVLWDGRPIAFASNRGTGEMTRVEPERPTARRSQDAIDADTAAALAWIATIVLPVPPEFQKHLGTTRTPAGLDEWIDELVNEEDNQRRAVTQLRRLLKKPLMVHQGKCFSLSGAWNPAHREDILRNYPNAQILNELPFEEALRRFRTAT